MPFRCGWSSSLCTHPARNGGVKMHMNEFFANWSLHRSQRAVESSPDDAKSWSKLYGIYAEQGKAVEFIEFCREFLKRWPGSQQAWKFLRMAGEGQVSDTEALEFCRDIVR